MLYLAFPERKKLVDERWQAKYPGRKRELNNQWYREHSEQKSKWDREYRAENKEFFRLKRLAKKYGISQDDYNARLEAQNHRCAICDTHVSQCPKNRLAVDHCHSTGRIRDLLCDRCNIGIGFLGDSIDILSKAIEYLKRHDAVAKR